jgi:hypothetical protein
MPSRTIPGAPGQVSSRDERTGSPTFIWADPSHRSPAVTAALASHASVDAVARAHVTDYAAHFGLDAAAIKALEVRHVHGHRQGRESSSASRPASATSRSSTSPSPW